MSFEIPPAVIHDLAEGMRTAEGKHADDYHAFADYMEECGSTPASSAFWWFMQNQDAEVDGVNIFISVGGDVRAEIVEERVKVSDIVPATAVESDDDYDGVISADGRILLSWLTAPGLLTAVMLRIVSPDETTQEDN